MFWQGKSQHLSHAGGHIHATRQDEHEELISVIEGYGDSRATGAQKTAVAKYERKYGLKDGLKVAREETKPEVKPTPEGGDQTPAWAQALIDSNKQLTERLK